MTFKNAEMAKTLKIRDFVGVDIAPLSKKPAVK